MNESQSINKDIQSGSRNVPNVLLIGDVFHTELRVFLYCHGPTEQMVILVGSSGTSGFMVFLECESLASQITFEASNTPHYCLALHLYDYVGLL